MDIYNEQKKYASRQLRNYPKPGKQSRAFVIPKPMDDASAVDFDRYQRIIGHRHKDLKR